MLNDGTVLVLGQTVLETRAQNTNKITALHVNKGKSHSEYFFFRSFFLPKITIMASVSKLFPSHENKIDTKFFRQFFFSEIRGSDDQKVRQKITMMATGSKRSRGPNKRMGKKYFQSSKFWPKNCPGVSRLFFLRDLLRQGNTNRKIDGSRNQT